MTSVNKADSPAGSGLTLLSHRHDPFVGWAPIHEFEDLFARLSGARLVSTTARPYPRLVRGLCDRLVGSVGLAQDVGSGEMLLIVARTPAELNGLRAIKGWRRRFRFVIGYVIDSFHLDRYSSATRHFDHVFTTTLDGAQFVRSEYGVSSSVLRTGFDCLQWSSTCENRSIDLLGFGRQPPSFHQHFQQSFHNNESNFLYLHSPIGVTHGPGVWIERSMMLRLMQRSKLSLAFHLLVEPHVERPGFMYLTCRWLESLAAGCIVVGRRPEGEMTEGMLNWPDATIELPADLAAASDLLKELAADSASLRRMRHRNVLEMCRQHDWRYRIRDILQHVGLPLPPQLRRELSALELKVQMLGAES